MKMVQYDMRNKLRSNLCCIFNHLAQILVLLSVSILKNTATLFSKILVIKSNVNS